MLDEVMNWDGTHVPTELLKLPPGRYVVVSIEDPSDLTPEEDAGIIEALNDLAAGKGLDLTEVMNGIQEANTHE